ncbi:MAG: hypothetical protein FWC84_01950, partial [Alphaproteobacteria bacterium]|nr:hypothetical protein [Alphaproteobacteria bacterium]
MAKTKVRPSFKPSIGLLVIGAHISLVGFVQAAEFAGESPPHEEMAIVPSVPCSVGAPFWTLPAVTADELPWASVWLGHFSGGRPYSDGNGQILIDWRDELVCFPTRQLCETWV